MFNRNTRWLLALLALHAGLAAALPEDQNQPIHISSDSALQENNVVTYRGNVEIVQGSIKINAAQVVIYHEKGKLQRAVATGTPVRFQERPELDGGLVTGHANTIVYYNADQRVELLQNAFVERDKSTVKSTRIEYLLPSKTVRAEGTANNSERVQMVLQPNQDKPAEAPPAPQSQPQPTSPPQPAQPAGTP